MNTHHGTSSHSAYSRTATEASTTVPLDGGGAGGGGGGSSGW